MDLLKIQSGASATPPAVPSSLSSGYPTAGTPGVTPPGKPGAYWYYQIVQEFHAVLAAAGITPDHTDLDQLLSAVQALIASADTTNTRAGHTYSGSDWCWLDKKRGLILQWVHVTAPHGTAVTFPITFPNECLRAIACHSDGATGALMVGVGAVTTSSAVVFLASASGSTGIPAVMTVLAIGR